MLFCVIETYQSINATVQETCRIRRTAPEDQNQAGISNQVEAGASATYLELGESTSDRKILAPRGLVTLALAMQTMGHRQPAGMACRESKDNTTMHCNDCADFYNCDLLQQITASVCFARPRRCAELVPGLRLPR